MLKWVCHRCGKRINEKHAYTVWGSDRIKGYMCFKCKKEDKKHLV